MEIELDRLVEHFTNISYRVAGVYHYTIEPGSSGRQKTSEFPGFIFPIGGRAQYHFDGTPYTAGRGKIVHGGADMILDKLVVGDTKWEYISVIYEIKGFEPAEISLPETHFEIVTGQNQHMTELLRRLHKTFSEPGSISAFQTEVLFRRVLEAAFVSARNQTNHGACPLYEHVTSYIQEHYMNDLSVRELAEQNGANENRLFYVFKKYTGMGPGEYLLQYRLNRAKELLITGDTAVGEIARSVGYDDPLYFSRIFKQRFGLPPSQLRAKFRNNPCIG
ncbi:HTH-type transcriptional activator RhaS [bioreactor metagenome]|uniref:HTH-type transcriptional activator RhaS n=1 Tax=bioreactor metagenome TaxID=1076179 RepID=A0A644X614_9ZZZZ